MVLETFIKQNGEKVEIYYDDWLYNQIKQKIIPNVMKKDSDLVIVIDGKERSGKSKFAQDLAFLCDKNFTLDRICMNPDEFRRAIKNAERGQAIIFDEAFTGLSSRGALSKINKILVEMMMEMGQKNLFVFIVLPSFFMLDKYVAIHRSSGLFHIYTKKGKRGYWVYFNREKKKILYIYGKRDMNYKPYYRHAYTGKRIMLKSKRRGRFYGKYVLDESEYRKKKEKALHKKEIIEKDIFKTQRDMLLFILNKEFNMKKSKISKMLSKYDIKLDRSSISKIISNIKNSKI